MRRWLVAVVVVVVLYIAVRLAIGAAMTMVDTPYGRAGSPPHDVTIASGASAADVADMLEAVGVVRSATTLRWWLRYTETAVQIHVGEYRFSGPLSVRQVAEIITGGRVLLFAVTVLEGATRWQVAEALAEAGFGSYDEAWEATGDTGLIVNLDTAATDLEGYLFPDTYHAPRGSTAAEIVGMMVARWRNVWNEERQARAAALGFTLRETVTFASLVEAETAMAEERRIVSGVYHNRLERRMLLQCDPTLLYALWQDGRTDRNIRRSDFANESPYNTYKFPGLPPGPIGNPGEASIDAALAPAEVDYLYFVGRNDGSHAFSRTLREHNANVNRYQR